MTYRVARLDSVAQVVMGQAPAGNTYNSEGLGWPLIAGAGDFAGDGLMPKKYTSAPTKLSVPGDIFISIRASIGARVLSDVEYCIGRGIASIRSRPEFLDSRYLWHWLDVAKHPLSAKGRGATFLQVSRADIASLEIPLPPLPEQRRIASILDCADDVRTKRRRGLALLEELVNSTFVDMFGGDEIAGGFPVMPLESVMETRGGLQISPARESLPIDVSYLRVANVKRGFMDLTEIKTMRVTVPELERTSLIEDDLLLVEGHGNAGEIGRAARWRGGPTAMTHQNHLIRVRARPGVLNSVFVERYLNSPVVRRYWTKVAKTTSGLNTINMSNVRALPVVVPPLKTQELFAAAALSAQNSRELQTVQLAELDVLFASLQHRAFRGEL